MVSVLLFLLGCALSSAHAKEGIWIGAFAQAPVGESEKVRLWLDLHDRRGKSTAVNLVRPAVGWSLTPRSSLWLGYAWIPTVPDEGAVTHEHRIWQQALLSAAPTDGLSLLLRPRLEERFLPGESLGLRVRLFGRAGLRLREDWGVALWDEVFVQLNEPGWTAPAGLDQNRLFVGPFVQPSPDVRVEVGYLQQWLPRPEESTLYHLSAMNLFVSF